MSTRESRTDITEPKSLPDVSPSESAQPEASGPAISRKVRGEHCVNIFISHELKEQLQHLAGKYDRTVADMVRAVLRIGIPMMEGLSEAEEIMVREYV